MKKYRFGRAERLKSRKVIGSLFKEGKSFGQYPIRFVWMEVPHKEGNAKFQFTATVPKRRFKRAVDRNKIRRQIKEAYRLHKHQLFEAVTKADTSYAIMVIYTGKEALPYIDIERAMRKGIGRVLSRLGEPSTGSSLHTPS